MVARGTRERARGEGGGGGGGGANARREELYDGRKNHLARAQ